MTIWLNSDNLNVKFARDEASKTKGGEYSVMTGQHIIEVDIPYTEVVSTSAVVVGSVANPGSIGVVVPKGFILDEVKTLATTAFTSSGTIGTSTMVLSLVKMDRSTALSSNTLTTTSFVGSVFDALGETTTITPGTTGAGNGFGVAMPEDGILVAANSQHASHPYTAGVLKVRIIGHY